jgi:hypothetical protein
MEKTYALRGQLGELQDLAGDAVNLFREDSWPELQQCLNQIAQQSAAIAAVLKQAGN